MITIFEAFAVIGMMATAVGLYMFIKICRIEYQEAEKMDINEIKEELPKWEKMNVVARMAKKELDEQYKKQIQGGNK